MTATRKNFWRCWVCAFLYKCSEQPTRIIVDEDVDRNLKWDKATKEKSSLFRLMYLLIKQEEFRNIFYLRMCDHPYLVAFSKWFLKDVESVEIAHAPIGGGFMISHNYAVVFPQSAGKNLRIGPGVVIGKKDGKSPVIGDNVYIAANSTVFGDITIGDNVIIGAGSVVTKDVPDNSVCAGNPARKIESIHDNPALLNEIC